MGFKLKFLLMVYADSIQYIYGLQKYGMKFGLDNIRRLLSALGNPERSFKSVHVAGTNGKGSVSASASAMLSAMGHKTGLFTSPHHVSFTERIRIDGTEIRESDVIRLAEKVKDASESIDGLSITFFEFVTALGFLYFRESGAEWAVIETGMGGRLDATNVIAPDASVITPISIDHAEFLGRTLSEIAEEKAGIIKPGIPIVSAAQDAGALGRLQKKAEETGSVFFLEGRDFFSEIIEADITGIRLSYQTANRTNGCEFFTPLSGRHQAQNAGLAIKAVEAATGKPVSSFYGQAKKALAELKWRGRLELISINPPILLDSAHNPSAAGTLAEGLNPYTGRFGPMTLVLGIMADKDIDGIMKPLMPLCSRIILTAPNFERAASPDELLRHARALGFDAETAPTVKEALERAVSSKGLTLVTGSFYTVGEAMEAMGVRGAFGDLREKF